MLWKCIRNLDLAIRNIFIIELLTECNFYKRVRNKNYYKGELVGIRKVDFLVEGIIPVEIKAATELSDLNIAQAKNYLEAGGIEIGLLINFGASSLQFKRMINNKVTHP